MVLSALLLRARKREKKFRVATLSRKDVVEGNAPSLRELFRLIAANELVDIVHIRDARLQPFLIDPLVSFLSERRFLLDLKFTSCRKLCGEVWAEVLESMFKNGRLLVANIRVVQCTLQDDDMRQLVKLCFRDRNKRDAQSWVKEASVLSFAGNQIGCAGVIEGLVPLFRQHLPQLIELDLRKNWVADDGACALSEALLTNSMLQTLRLDYNRIGPRGASALARMLETNQGIERLYLRGNQARTSGGLAFAVSVAKNDVLGVLDLRDNSLGSMTAREIQRVVRGKQDALKECGAGGSGVQLQTLLSGNAGGECTCSECRIAWKKEPRSVAVGLDKEEASETSSGEDDD